MAFGLFTRWHGQTEKDWTEQDAAWEERFLYEGWNGHIGDTNRRPLQCLAKEAFHPEEGEPIPAAVLRSRLNVAIELAKQTMIEAGDSERQIEHAIRGYTAFVEFCEQKEKETGEPVTVIACY
jgi:hypothetical protein